MEPGTFTFPSKLLSTMRLATKSSLPTTPGRLWQRLTNTSLKELTNIVSKNIKFLTDIGMSNMNNLKMAVDLVTFNTVLQVFVFDKRKTDIKAVAIILGKRTTIWIVDQEYAVNVIPDNRDGFIVVQTMLTTEFQTNLDFLNILMIKLNPSAITNSITNTTRTGLEEMKLARPKILAKEVAPLLGLNTTANDVYTLIKDARKMPVVVYRPIRWTGHIVSPAKTTFLHTQNTDRLLKPVTQYSDVFRNRRKKSNTELKNEVLENMMESNMNAVSEEDSRILRTPSLSPVLTSSPQYLMITGKKMDPVLRAETRKRARTPAKPKRAPTARKKTTAPARPIWK